MTASSKATLLLIHSTGPSLVRPRSHRLAAILASLLFTTPAAAQMNMPGMSEYPQNHYVPTVDEILTQIQVEKWQEEDRRNGKLPPVPEEPVIPAALAAFTFKRSVVLDWQSINRHADRMKITVKSDALNKLRDVMAEQGLSADNMSDCLAFWWVVSWQSALPVYGRKSDIAPSKIKEAFRAVSLQAGAMMNDPQIIAYSDEMKQQWSDQKLLEAYTLIMLAGSAKNDPQLRMKLAENSIINAKNASVDITNADLTEKGFVQR